MTLALVFFEARMLEDTLGSYHNTRGNNLLLDFPIGLLELLTC